MRQWRFSGKNAKYRRREKIARLRVICTACQIVFLYVCFVFHLQKSGATFSCGVLRKNSAKATSVAKKSAALPHFFVKNSLSNT